jgi:hypothetical protein
LNGLLSNDARDLIQGLTIPTLDVVEALGYAYTPNFTSFTLNGLPVTIDTGASSYTASTKRLLISTARLIDLNQATPSNPLIFSWNHT